VAVIGGFRFDLSITRKTDGNFENVSAGVLFSKNSSHVLNFIVIGQTQLTCQNQIKLSFTISHFKSFIEFYFPLIRCSMVNINLFVQAHFVSTQCHSTITRKDSLLTLNLFGINK